MQNDLRRPESGFTLVELLTVIAIIGILAAILIPTVGKVRDSAQRTVDANQLREIGKAALLYAIDHQDRLPDPLASHAATLSGGTPLFRWMGLLGRAGTLNDASLYFSRSDPWFDGVAPSRVVDPQNRQQLDPQFVAKTPSFEFVGGLKLGDPANTPLAFTRGLRPDGTWDAESGVYRQDGGHIVFLGGHVRFYKAIDGQLTRPDGQPTDNLAEAIPTTPGGSQRIYGKAAIIGTEAGTEPTSL